MEYIYDSLYNSITKPITAHLAVGEPIFFSYDYMSHNALKNIEQIESSLWEAADQLRAN